MTDAFYWIGVTVVGAAALVAVIFAAMWIYVRLLHERFQLIFFQESVQRLSLASWHQSRMHKPDIVDNAEWPADDYPIGTRPFFLSYKFRGRQFFVMVGVLEQRRNRSIEGTHP